MPLALSFASAAVFSVVSSLRPGPCRGRPDDFEPILRWTDRPALSHPRLSAVTGPERGYGPAASLTRRGPSWDVLQRFTVGSLTSKLTVGGCSIAGGDSWAPIRWTYDAGWPRQS